MSPKNTSASSSTEKYNASEADGEKWKIYCSLNNIYMEVTILPVVDVTDYNRHSYREVTYISKSLEHGKSKKGGSKKSIDLDVGKEF